MKKRKTYTSPEVKNRWNARHYDRMQLVVPIGAKAEIQAIAEKRGMSTAAYIRSLIIADNAENPENTYILRGGGVADAYEALKDGWNTFGEAWQRLANTMDGEDPGQLWL